MFSLESPHRGDSNEKTQYIIFNMKKQKNPELSQICSYDLFHKGLKNEFETAVVNELSVFEPLKFYCKKVVLKIVGQLRLAIRFQMVQDSDIVNFELSLFGQMGMGKQSRPRTD